MAARRRPQSEINRRFRALRPFIDPKAFPKNRDGTFTAASTRRLNSIFAELSPVIVNRNTRVYRPRKRENAKAFENMLGVKVLRKKGVVSLPVVLDRKSDKVRIRFGKEAISLSFQTMRGRKFRRRFNKTDEKKLTRNAEKLIAEKTRGKKDKFFRIRTGTGWLGKGEGQLFLGSDVAEAIRDLLNGYGNASTFILGIEEVEDA